MPSDHIRLLRLNPGAHDHQLRFDLEVVKIGNLPHFTALSYTWNPNFPKHLVSCGEAEIAIGHNLWLCLLQLRQTDDHQCFWIDAICINQEDKDERTQQVQLMRLIYQSAEDAIVWLGDHFDNVREGVELAQQLSRIHYRLYGPEGHRSFSTLTFRELGLPEADHVSWKALDAILWAPWFTRAWIVQEVAVASNVTMRISDQVLHFSEMERAVQCISWNSMTQQTGVDPVRARILTEYRRKVQWGGENSRSTLYDQLALGRRCYASDPRDKIYAFLGIASDNEALAVIPDYNIKESAAYLRTARRLIENYDTLDVLSQAETGLRAPFKYIPPLPSWTPDWNAHPVARLFHTCDKWTEWCTWTSSTVPYACAMFEDDGRTMMVTGRIIDVIKWKAVNHVDVIGNEGGIDLTQSTLSNAPQSIVSLLGLGYTLVTDSRLRQWHDIAHRAVGQDNYTHTSEGTLDAFARTIIADAKIRSMVGDQATVTLPSSEQQSRTDPPSATTSYKAWYGITAHSVSPLPNNTPLYNKSWPAHKIYVARQYRDLHHIAAFGRCFIVSKKKRYMGLCYPRVLHGDHIVLLHGARTPFILRRNRCKKSVANGEETWTFLGEAYIHGLMRCAEDANLDEVGAGPLRSFRLV